MKVRFFNESGRPSPVTNREAIKAALIGAIWVVCTIYAASLWVLA